MVSGLASRPRAILVISAHWECDRPTLQASPSPGQLFDYYGFPAHTYKLSWRARGAPKLAHTIQHALTSAGIPTDLDLNRPYDHGVFIPLLLATPAADIPTLQLSLSRSLDPALHLRIGRALRGLRDQGVLILGSGMSFHNLRDFGGPGTLAASHHFNDWLIQACTDPLQSLLSWEDAPSARTCHPREEHLLPLMVCAGAGDSDPGHAVFRGEAMGVEMLALRFG